MEPMCADACRFAAGSEQQHLNTGKRQGISAIEFLHALKCERHSLSGTSGQSAPTIMFIKLNEKNTLSAGN